MSQSTQCLGSIVLLAMFWVSNVQRMTHCKWRTSIFRALLRGNYEEPGGPFGWFRAQPFPLDRPPPTAHRAENKFVQSLHGQDVFLRHLIWWRFCRGPFTWFKTFVPTFAFAFSACLPIVLEKSVVSVMSCLSSDTHSKMAPNFHNGQKWPEIVRNGQKWIKCQKEE